MSSVPKTSFSLGHGRDDIPLPPRQCKVRLFLIRTLARPQWDIRSSYSIVESRKWVPPSWDCLCLLWIIRYALRPTKLWKVGTEVLFSSSWWGHWRLLVQRRCLEESESWAEDLSEDLRQYKIEWRVVRWQGEKSVDQVNNAQSVMFPFPYIMALWITFAQYGKRPSFFVQTIWEP